MSGEKRSTITLDEDTYRRLNASEHQLRAMRQDLPGILQRTQMESAREMQNLIAPLEQRTRQFEASVRHLDAQVQGHVQETTRQLDQQRREFARSLEHVQGELYQLANETEYRFRAQRREFDDKLEQQRHSLQQEIHMIGSRLTTLEEQDQRKKELANAWLQAARTSHESIAQNPRHELFAPGQLLRQSNELRLAEKTVEIDPSAALVRAQDVAQALAELMAELQEKELEMQLWRSAALSTARALEEMLRKSAHIEILDLEGQPTGDLADVDFWTKGKFSALSAKVSSLIARIEDVSSPLLTAELKNLSEIELPALDQEVNQVIQEARAEFLGAQVRFDVAETVGEQVSSLMFSFEGATYEAEDMRAAYVSKFRHRDGGEVTIRVAPVEGQPGVNSLHIHSYDADVLEPEELEARQQEVLEMLTPLGLTVSHNESFHEPDPTFRNLKDVAAMPSPVEASRAQR